MRFLSRLFGRNPESARDYDRAVNDFSQTTDQATALLQAGQYDEAIAHCTEEIRLRRSAVGAYFSRGQAYQDKGQCDLAIADFTQVIKLAPKAGSYSGIDFSYLYLVASHRFRGSIYLERKEYDRAVADFSEVIRLKPIDREAFANRAVAYRALAVMDERKAQELESLIDPEEEENE